MGLGTKFDKEQKGEFLQESCLGPGRSFSLGYWA